MNLEEFSNCVRLAIEELPTELRDKLTNVEVIVEDFASPETLQDMGMGSPYELLGLYQGIPVTHRSFFSVTPLPDTIHVYRIPVLTAAGSPRNVLKKIREVVMHEVGHHFGFDDEELEAMERSVR